MRIRNRAIAVLALAPLGLVPAAAFADDVTNNIDGTVDAVAEVMPLTIGGPNGTTKLYVTPQNGDGKPGCNLAANKTLTVSVASSAPSVATVDQSSVTFTDCGEANGRQLIMTPLQPGNTQISVTQTGNTTNGTFALASATFRVVVSSPPNHAPTVAVTGVVGGASYAKGTVPTATCAASDAEDGNSTFPATLSAVTGPNADDGLGSQTASCSYTDAGGLVVVGSETYSIFDPTAPVITHVLNPAAPTGSNGWYTGDVSLNWTVTEPESPNSLVPTGCVDRSITTDQAPTTYSCSATSAGGAATEQDVQIERDATAPADVAFVGGPVNDGLYYPNNVPAAGTCTATDATSGLAGCVVSGRSEAVGDHTMTATATDKAGNTATATVGYTVRRLTLNGFFQPVDMSGVLNTVKAGSTVPLKFRVYDRGVEVKSTTIVTSVKQALVPCSATAPEDAIEEIVNAGASSLRYDTTAGQFVQNWKTPTGAGTCYKVTLTTVDDSTTVALFKLK